MHRAFEISRFCQLVFRNFCGIYKSLRRIHWVVGGFWQFSVRGSRVVGLLGLGYAICCTDFSSNDEIDVREMNIVG